MKLQLSTWIVVFCYVNFVTIWCDLLWTIHKMRLDYKQEILISAKHQHSDQLQLRITTPKPQPWFQPCLSQPPIPSSAAVAKKCEPVLIWSLTAFPQYELQRCFSWKWDVRVGRGGQSACGQWLEEPEQGGWCRCPSEGVRRNVMSLLEPQEIIRSGFGIWFFTLVSVYARTHSLFYIFSNFSVPPAYLTPPHPPSLALPPSLCSSLLVCCLPVQRLLRSMACHAFHCTLRGFSSLLSSPFLRTCEKKGGNGD